MATPNKYVKVQMTVSAVKHPLSGYRVIGDYQEGGVRYITLERPETASKGSDGSKPIVRRTRRSAVNQASTSGTPVEAQDDVKG